MAHRGLAVASVAALATAAALLLPADARADRHGMECFGGFSFGSGSTLKGGSVSCGIYVDFFVKTDAEPVPPPVPPPVPYQEQDTTPTPSPLPTPGPPPAQGDAQPTPRTDRRPDTSATTAFEPPVVPRRWFVVADVSRLSGDHDDGEAITRHLITLGLQRYLFVRDKRDSEYARPRRWHTFLRAMGGLTVTGGRHPAEFGPALAAGAGIDLRLYESRKAGGWGNVFLRGQCDLAYLFDPEKTTWRCAAGPSFRDEDY